MRFQKAIFEKSAPAESQIPSPAEHRERYQQSHRDTPPSDQKWKHQSTSVIMASVDFYTRQYDQERVLTDRNESSLA